MNAQPAALRDNPPAENSDLIRQSLQASDSVRDGDIETVIRVSLAVPIDRTENLRLV